MNCKETSSLSTLSKISGILQALACMEGATITKGLAAELEHRAECLEIYIAEQILKDVKDRENTEKVFDNIIP